MSIRRACACLRVDTSLYHYKSKRGDQAALKVRIKEIAATRVRYGYRRVHVLLRREGWPVNAKRMVIPPFLTGLRSRIHAAIFSFCAGVTPPMPILGRSLL